MAKLACAKMQQVEQRKQSVSRAWVLLRVVKECKGSAKPQVAVLAEGVEARRRQVQVQARVSTKEASRYHGGTSKQARRLVSRNERLDMDS